MFVKEIAALYAHYQSGQPLALEPLKIQYPDFAQWQRGWLTGDLLDKQLGYWREQLAFSPEQLSMPFDRPRPAIKSSNGSTIDLAFSNEQTQKIKQVAREFDVTPYILLLAAYKVLLGRWSGQKDICVGMPVAGRTKGELEPLIGFFINTLVIRTKQESNPTFASFVSQVKEQVLGAQAHQDVPFEAIVEDLKVPRNLSFSPIYQVAFSLTSGEGAAKDSVVGGLEIQPMEVELTAARQDITTMLVDNGDTLEGMVEYNTDLFDRDTMQVFAEQLHRLVLSVVEAPEQTVLNVSLENLNAIGSELYGLDADKTEAIKLVAPMVRDFCLDTFADPTTHRNSVGYRVDLPMAIDVETWKKAQQALVDHTPVLRSRFVEGRKPWHEPVYQVVLKQDAVAFEFIDLTANPIADVNLNSYIEKLALPNWDLRHGQLHRHFLLKLADDQYIAVAAFHHAITDGVSHRNHITQVMSAYEALTNGQSVSFASDTNNRWVDDRRLQTDSESVNAFWSKELADVEPLGKRLSKAGELVRSHWQLDKAGFELLQSWCKNNSAGPANYLRTLFALAIEKCYYENGDFVLTEAVSARKDTDANQLGCLFQFTVFPVKAALLTSDITLGDLLAKHRAWKKSVGDNVYLSMLARKRFLNTNGLEFQFNYRLANAVGGLTVDGQAISYEPIQPVNPGTVKLLSTPTDNGLTVELAYRENEFNGYLLLERMQAVHEQIIAGVENLQQLEWLLGNERAVQLEEWQGVQSAEESAQTVVDQIILQATNTPNEIAVKCGAEELTYQAFHEKSNQIANQLIAQGVAPGDNVGVCLGRRVELPVAILGVMKAKAAYVPIDPAYPCERIEYILADSAAKSYVTESCVAERLAEYKLTASALDIDGEAFSSASTDTPAALPTANDLIYVVYTSGSTGKPKGAGVYHRGEQNLASWYVDHLRLQQGDRVLLMSAIGFDLTQKNLIAPFTVGATLVIPDFEEYDPQKLAAIIDAENVAVINSAPSAFYPIAEDSTAKGYPFPSLKNLMLGGEPIRIEALQEWLAQSSQCRITNSYGPTECTDVVAAWSLETADIASRELPIGKPLPNTQLYVVDPAGNLLPNGATGELCVAGIGVGAGYLNRDDLNAEVFQPCPYSDGQWYRTGDLVHYREDGALVYEGRKDFQVKLRGLRIEPGEIDNRLKDIDYCEDALTLVIDDRLVSYVVCHGDFDNAAAKNNLREHLPEFMVPGVLVELDAWPLTPNGKIDRKALPEPSLVAQEGMVAPRNDSEEKIADIWCQVLNLSEVSVTANFFDLGGHSLLATQVVSRLRQAFGVELSVRSLFESPTIEALVNVIGTAKAAGWVDTAPTIAKAEGVEKVLSFAQHRLWFIDQLNQGSAEYNMPAAMRVEGELDIKVLDQALTEIVRRHEVLRTNFGATDGEPTLIVREAPQWTTNIIDLSSAPDSETAIAQQVDVDANKVFNLESDLLLSTTLLKVAENDHVLLINMHHIVSDGWSIGVFIQELTALYQAYINQQQSPLPELPVQYSDYALWQRDWLKDEVLDRLKHYWLETLGDAPEVLRLPTDFPRPKQQTFNGAHHAHELGQERTALLNSFCEENDVTPFMVLMGTFQILLSRYCHQDDICVGIPIAGRNRAEIENLIGFFINGLVIRTKLDGNPKVTDYLERVKEAALGAYAHQDMPADVLADTLKLSRSAEHAPGAQVGFALQNTPQEQLGAEFAGLKLTPVTREHKTAKYEFSLILQENNENIGGVVEYNTDLFKAETIATMMSHFNRILDQLLKGADSYIDNIDVLSANELYEALNVDPSEFELIELSPMQRDQYLDALVEPDSLKNSMGYHLLTDGEFDMDIWRQAAQKLIDDQPLLRCSLIGSDLPYTDVAYHCIRKQKTLEMEYLDISDQELTDKEAQQIAMDWVWRPYDISKDELTEYRVYKLNAGRHMMCFRMNHLVADGVGMALHSHCNVQVADAIKAGVQPPQIPPLFFQHIKENRVRMDKPETLAYWKDLSKNVEALDFSIPPQFAEDVAKGERVEKRLRVSDEHWNKIKSYCKDIGIHPSLYFKAIYGLLINVYCRGESDFYFTEVLAGRGGMHKMTFGNYFQLLPVVCPQDLFESSKDVTDLFGFIKGYKRNLRKLADISLMQQRRILPQGRLNFMFNYYNFIPILNLHGTPIQAEACPQIQDGPIQFVIHEQGPWMELVIIYLSNLFTDLRFLERVEYLSQQIMDGTTNVSELEYILPDEKTLQLGEWNQTTSLPAPTETVVDQFLTQAAATPNALAVQMGDKQLTYAELNQRSNQLANLLIREGVTRGDRVGICLDRSVDMLVAVLGVMKSGSAYVPMDSNYPSERLAYMLSDSRAPVLLSQRCVVDRLESDQVTLADAQVICLDETSLEGVSDSLPSSLPRSEDLIYIIYTSGSTGQPKGATVMHQGESNLMGWYTEQLGLSDTDRCLLVSAFGFDLTQKNLFAPLIKGGAIIIPDMEQYDVEAIADAIHQHNVTVVNCAPSAFYAIAENTAHAGYPFSSMRYLVLGGEPIRVDALKPWLDHNDSNCRLVNSYGPTECTDVVSSYELVSTDESILPIGKPVQNTQLYVVDEVNKLLPQGVVGELCIAGRGVGQGYLNKDELTEKAFGENPFAADESNQRWYRTGDLVRYWPDGNIEYMGRKDFQVKLRGLRIELGEIESALRQQSGVEDSLTLVVEDRLISYVIAASIDEIQLRNQLRAHLPDYMLPAVIVALPQWPLTPNGKIDRKALPSPENKPLVEYVAPRNDVEERLANIWSEVLGVDKVGVYDNFFDLGGHSLLAARAVSKFRNEFDVEIPLRALFELHTVADIAEYLQTLLWVSESAEIAKEESTNDADANREEGFL
ncbi:MAG: amino acid adenylation domain-containing protein [Pseudomonadales bacterium]|nr:amino acid adenylation domain-containing protein [Pseudomonadales bacterium]